MTPEELADAILKDVLVNCTPREAKAAVLNRLTTYDPVTEIMQSEEWFSNWSCSARHDGFYILMAGEHGSTIVATGKTALEACQRAKEPKP